MAKYIIDSATLDGLGDAIRSVTGSTKKYTPEEMIAEVKDILNATTFILVDKDGNEYPAVYVDSDTVITATPNDIRKGTTAITAEGVIEGTKEIPNYRAVEGCVYIDGGERMIISLYSDMCEYTTLQAIICEYNTDSDDSVSAQKVVIKDKVYDVGSTSELTTVTVIPTEHSIDLGIDNDDTPKIIRYMIIKEDT
jgi:hypothetical protein